MQRLDLNDEGKLVAFTDNGCTDGKSATTELKGTFEVSADVVKFILAKEYGLPSSVVAKIEKIGLFGFTYSENLHFSLDNDSMNRKIDELEMLKNAADKKYLDLKGDIDDFNRTRRFYERKIKV